MNASTFQEEINTNWKGKYVAVLLFSELQSLGQCQPEKEITLILPQGLYCTVAGAEYAFLHLFCISVLLSPCWDFKSQ